MSAATIAGKAEWLADDGLRRLLAALCDGGEEARVAGGAVRNALLGQPVTDIDVATTTLPDETIARAETAGFRAVPTGKEHGTITVVVAGRPYEVTTLRDDVETFGRHATVSFGRDWKRDAERRDFTINALYAELDGRVIDLVGGLADLEHRRLRFIGDAEARIREDYLRILRFFRFFAWYGSGRPDAEGLKACARLKDGLAQLSAERVWTELRKLLSAPDPARALLWMRQSGVLTAVLPESEKWGIDSMHGLGSAERDLGWSPDAMLRLAAIIPPDATRVEAMARRLRMSRQEAERLTRWALTPAPSHDMDERAFERTLYAGDRQAIEDRLRLALAAARSRANDGVDALVEAGGLARLLTILGNWQRPELPIKGKDLLALGLEPGPRLGKLMNTLETEWADGGFSADREALMARAAQLAEANPFAL